MKIIDADKFLAYLIFSKHIDGLTCGEVKEAIEMCKVDVFDKIRAEILHNAFLVANPKNTYEFISAIDLNSIDKILDKYKAESEKV